jgi:hypothetical protein
MMSTLNITGKKEKVIGKYMRQHLGPAFCPTLRSLPPTSRFRAAATAAAAALLPPRCRQPRGHRRQGRAAVRCCPPSDFFIACRHATINALVAGRFRR